MHLKLKDQQFKTILFIYRLLYHNLVGNTNQKSTIDTKKKKESKQNTKISHQIGKEEDLKVKLRKQSHLPLQQKE